MTEYTDYLLPDTPLAGEDVLRLRPTQFALIRGDHRADTGVIEAHLVLRFIAGDDAVDIQLDGETPIKLSDALNLELEEQPEDELPEVDDIDDDPTVTGGARS